MEYLGAVAASVQLAEMTGKVLLQLYRCYHEMKDAPNQSKELCDEMSELSSVLEHLADAIKKANDTCNDIVGDIISASSLQKYSDFLNDFRSQIKVDRKDIKMRLK